METLKHPGTAKEYYTRKYYPSRGHRPERDDIYNTVVEFTKAGCCVICGERLERKVGKTGKDEDWNRFFQRKTCGVFFDEGSVRQKGGKQDEKRTISIHEAEMGRR